MGTLSRIAGAGKIHQVGPRACAAFYLDLKKNAVAFNDDWFLGGFNARHLLGRGREGHLTDESVRTDHGDLNRNFGADLSRRCRLANEEVKVGRGTGHHTRSEEHT